MNKLILLTTAAILTSTSAMAFNALNPEDTNPADYDTLVGNHVNGVAGDNFITVNSIYEDRGGDQWHNPTHMYIHMGYLQPFMLQYGIDAAHSVLDNIAIHMNGFSFRSENATYAEKMIDISKAYNAQNATIAEINEDLTAAMAQVGTLTDDLATANSKLGLVVSTANSSINAYQSVETPDVDVPTQSSGNEGILTDGRVDAHTSTVGLADHITSIAFHIDQAGRRYDATVNGLSAAPAVAGVNILNAIGEAADWAYENGWEDGWGVGFEEGYTEGYDDGYQDGYQDGWDDAWEAAKDLAD